MNVQAGFDASKENLLCLMVLDDNFSSLLTNKAGEAFWRAFIVEDRATHIVKANFRFRYADGDHWYEIIPKNQANPVETMKEIVANLPKAITLSIKLFLEIEDDLSLADKITCFYPPHPDNSEDVMRYLIEEDLIFIDKVLPK